MSQNRLLHLVMTMGIAAGMLACTPKRLVDLSAKPDLRTEQMVRAGRFLTEARALFDAGKAAEAHKMYLAALVEYALIAEAHQGLGNVYELEGDRQSALAEYVAHTEVAPRSRMYMDRMLGYLTAKFARNPASPEEISVLRQATAMVELSRALDDQRNGRSSVALARLDKVRDGLPRAGLVEYLAGWWRLRAGEADAALEQWVQAAGHNAYFVRQLLAERAEERLPALLPRLRDELVAQLRDHPSDAESILMLATLALRLGQAEDALRVARQALAWGKPTWEILFVKAAAHDKLGQAVARDQALVDLKSLRLDLATAFSSWEPSLFAGVLGGQFTDLAAGPLAGMLAEPAASYLRWRLWSEAGRREEAEQAKTAYERAVEQHYSPGEFLDLPGTDEPKDQPKSISEFLGAVQDRVAAVMPALWTCDLPRRAKRAQPSGRVTLRVEVGREGAVAHAAVVENTTDDPVLAYCVVRKVLALRFPRPLRASEVFQVPVMFGPEIDGLMDPGASRSPDDPQGVPADKTEH
jgi:tetratricopeptide (TPR) repeat protein